MPHNVSYGQHGFNSPPMINTGGPQSPGMSSGGIPSPGSVHSSRSGMQVCFLRSLFIEFRCVLFLKISFLLNSGVLCFKTIIRNCSWPGQSDSGSWGCPLSIRFVKFPANS